MAALVLGLALRAMLLGQRAPLWGDEAMVAVGILRGGWADLLRPLDHYQVAGRGTTSSR